jgi:hypothetical protein
LLGVLHALLLGRAARRACQELGAWVDSGERCRGNFLRAHGVLQGARPWKPGWPAAGTSAGFAPKQRGAISQVGLRMLSHHGNTDKPVGFIKRQKGKADTHVTGVNMGGYPTHSHLRSYMHSYVHDRTRTITHAHARKHEHCTHEHCTHACVYTFTAIYTYCFTNITSHHATLHHITSHCITPHDIT